MRKEDCEYIKDSVYKYIAQGRPYYGRIPLSEVYRLFSRFGSVEELEKCLDDFVKNGLAAKIVENGEKKYVFRYIASESEKRLREELDELIRQKEQANREIASIRNAIRILNEICNIWQEGWENVEKHIQLHIKNYVVNFWQQAVNEYVKKLDETKQKINRVENRIREIKDLLREP